MVCISVCFICKIKLNAIKCEQKIITKIIWFRTAINRQICISTDNGVKANMDLCEWTMELFGNVINGAPGLTTNLSMWYAIVI